MFKKILRMLFIVSFCSIIGIPLITTNFQQDKVSESENRKLTVRECLRLQGFPESYKMKDNYSQSYKQIGNSVTVPVIKLIAKEMVKYLE